VALVFFEDKAVGVLEILNHAHNQVFSNQLVKLAQELAPAVGSVLAKLREEEKREILHEAGLIVQQVGNLGGQLVKLNELLVDLFDGDGATIFSVDEERQEIFTRIKTEEGVQELRFPIGLKSIVGWVAQEKYMINLADVYDPDNRARYHPDLCFDESWDRIAGKRTHAMLCCPLINQEKVLGVVQVVNRLDKEGFDHLCERNMVTLSQILAPAFGMKVKPVEWKPTKFSYLLDHGYLTQEELEAALAVAREQNAALEKILLEEKRVASGVLGKSYEAFFGVPYLGYKETVLVPPRNFNGLNPSHLRRQHWVPLEREESRVVVLVDDPGNEEKIQEIRNVFQGQEVKFKVGLRSDIDQYLTAALPKERLGPEDGAAADTEPSPEPVDSPPGAAGVVTPDNPAVVHQVHQILSRALEQGAADIHFEPQPAGDLQVRLRRESGCEVIDTVSSTHHWAVVNRLKVLSKIDPAAACLPQEGRVTLRFGDRDVTLWTVILPTLGGVEDVVVHISQAESPRPLAEMGLSRRDETVVLEALAKPQGLALVGGPPGPGKNALLHSLLARLNTPGRKLWTAEHPVEIVHPGVRQMPMNPRGGLDCARALDAIMLGDPDVVLIGDIPDRETGAMVLQASLGGTLVLGSLNAPGTCQTVVRCLELGLDPARLAEALTVVLAQRFGKALCPSCKESYRPGQEEYDALVREYGEQEWSGLGVKGPSKLRLHRGRGCPQCWDTGYAGRVGLYEVLQITPAMKGLIREGAGREELRLQALADGMTTMKQDGIGKVIAGECDFQQVAAVGL
ncbi:MAG: ATPase, T2SS/T4P/T4SS family, partial [Nitrospinaceae bacterium]